MRHDIITVGASAGGVEALTKFAGYLPPGFPASVFVVLHLPTDYKSRLPSILNKAGPLPATAAKDGGKFHKGRIYVAPPDRHLVLEKGKTKLLYSARQNNHRPAIDPLFVSAARHYGRRVVGVLLSGADDDGALGLGVIREAGGLTVVQAPDEALFPQMPESAMDADGHYVAPISQMSSLFLRMKPKTGGRKKPPMAGLEEAMPENMDDKAKKLGAPSLLTCPDCGGALWQTEPAGVLSYDCHVGHRYTPQALELAQNAHLEAGLWTAIRMLSERATFQRRLAQRFKTRNSALSADYERRAWKSAQEAAQIHTALTRALSRPPNTQQ